MALPLALARIGRFAKVAARKNSTRVAKTRGSVRELTNREVNINLREYSKALQEQINASQFAPLDSRGTSQLHRAIEVVNRVNGVTDPRIARDLLKEAVSLTQKKSWTNTGKSYDPRYIRQLADKLPHMNTAEFRQIKDDPRLKSFIDGQIKALERTQKRKADRLGKKITHMTDIALDPRDAETFRLIQEYQGAETDVRKGSALKRLVNRVAHNTMTDEKRKFHEAKMHDIVGDDYLKWSTEQQTAFWNRFQRFQQDSNHILSSHVALAVLTGHARDRENLISFRKDPNTGETVAIINGVDDKTWGKDSSMRKWVHEQGLDTDLNANARGRIRERDRAHTDNMNRKSPEQLYAAQKVFATDTFRALEAGGIATDRHRAIISLGAKAGDEKAKRWARKLKIAF